MGHLSQRTPDGGVIVEDENPERARGRAIVILVGPRHLTRCLVRYSSSVVRSWRAMAGR
jgi:hypothetical protein